jgi:DNA primase
VKVLTRLYQEEFINDLRHRADIVEVIRDYLPLKKQGQNYMGLCPFHSEKTASLKAHKNNKSFKCFGCNVSGSVIDFVMKLYNISFSQAVIRINNDFGLNLTDKKPDLRTALKIQQQRVEQEKELADYRQMYMTKVNEHRRLFLAKRDKQPEIFSDIFDDEYVEACHKLDTLNAWFESNRWR